MRSLPRPDLDALEVFRLCNSKLVRPELVARMKNSESEIQAGDYLYREAAAQAKLYLVDEDNFKLEKVTKNEMLSAYNNRLVGREGPGRPVYEKLLLGSDVCPLCGEGVVAALDHHLPKKDYYGLALNPNNLVPICSDCNKAKLDFSAANAEEQPLHPYFDRIDDVRWLQAEVKEDGVGVVLFRVEPSDDWDEVLAVRVKRHFKQLNLGELYSKKAATELSMISYELVDLFCRLGKSAVQETLRTRAIGRMRQGLNSWQAATYDALAECEWYYSGGFSSSEAIAEHLRVIK